MRTKYCIAADTFCYSDETDSLHLLSFAARAPGDECFAVYGTYPNAKLAFSYGFVILGNPHQAVDLWTRVGPSTSQAERKQSILSAHTLTKQQPYDFSGTVRPGYISPALLATVRIIQCNEEEIETGAFQLAFEGRLVSVRNEVAAYTSLKSLIGARIKQEEAEVTFLLKRFYFLNACSINYNNTL